MLNSNTVFKDTKEEAQDLYEKKGYEDPAAVFRTPAEGRFVMLRTVATSVPPHAVAEKILNGSNGLIMVSYVGPLLDIWTDYNFREDVNLTESLLKYFLKENE